MKFKLDLNLQKGEYISQVADLLGEVSESKVVELLQDQASVIVEAPESSIPSLMVWYGWSSLSADADEFINQFSVR